MIERMEMEALKELHGAIVSGNGRKELGRLQKELSKEEGKTVSIDKVKYAVACELIKRMEVVK